MPWAVLSPVAGAWGASNAVAAPAYFDQDYFDAAYFEVGAWANAPQNGPAYTTSNPNSGTWTNQ